MSDRQPSSEVHPDAANGSGSAEPNARAGFLGFVAHEMRNPLSTALWSAELLARLSPEERGGARGEKLSGMCLRALQRLRLLMEDHFLAERLDVDGITFRLEAVSARVVMESAAGRAGVADLTLEGVENLLLWADRGVLERACEGLLATAARGQAPVRVEGSRQGDLAFLRVHGSPPAAEVLEMPRKGSPSDPSGRALAAFAASRVAEALGGRLQLEGGGFLLTVPLAPAGANADAPT